MHVVRSGMNRGRTFTMSFVPFIRGLPPPRAALAALAVAACLVTEIAAARGGPQGRRVSAPRIAFENRGGRPADPALRAPRVARERPVEAAPTAEPTVPAAPAERARPGRLTPDERRALRQQINDAGRDIYRPGRP